MMPVTAPPPGFLDAVLRTVRRRTGLVFSEGRRAAFESALARSMTRVHQPEPDGYLRRLEGDVSLLDDLVGEITVGETYFFREPGQFALIRDTILPSLLARRPAGRPMRVWSAGCATGEEPYSLAITLREHGAGDGARIVATDISRGALARARRGLYGRWSLRGAPAGPVQRYFSEVGAQFEIARPLREAVEFRYLNLAEDAFPSVATGIWGLDLVLCRNVLIYFDAETIARVARGLIGSLADDGWLLLGASDPILTDFVRCDVIVTEAGLAYRRPECRAETVPAREPAMLAPALPAAIAAVPADAAAVPAADEQDAAQAYADRDYPRAEALVRRGIEADPANPALWVLLVRSLANRGELSAAGQACAVGLDRHRTCAELTYLHAVLLAEAGRYEEGAEVARRAVYLDRGFIVAHLLVGAARNRLSDAEGAARALRNAERLLLAMHPDDVVPASDGEPARRLTEMVRLQLRLLREPTA
jgi:chemotaxis protein methyltransferase CheR